MTSVEESIAQQQLVGELVWGVTRSIGSYLTMEFGPPHLEVRDPVAEVASTQPRVREALMSRRVWTRGETHLWVQDCRWTLGVRDDRCDSESPPSTIDTVLPKLEGQVLASVTGWKEERRQFVSLEFDLGGRLAMSWDEEPNSEEIAFSLWRSDGAVTTVHLSGELSRENVTPMPRVPGQRG